MQYDVFISCRHTGSDGKVTHDIQIAQSVFDFLSSRGIRCFWAEKSLVTIGQSEYKKAIDDVLDQVPILVVVATSVENLESKWVRYEWDSFHNDILSRRKSGVIIPYIDSINVNDLPRTLRQCQAIQQSDTSLNILTSHITATLGLRQVEDMTRNGQKAVEKLDMLNQVMAESRLLELEILSGMSNMFGMFFSTEQSARMQNHINDLKRILDELSQARSVSNNSESVK